MFQQMLKRDKTMKIIEIDKEQFNNLGFDVCRQLHTKMDKELMVESVMKWAAKLGADVVYKFKDTFGYKWTVEVK